VPHQVAEMVFAARVTALAHHGPETAGGEPRVLLQGLPHEGQKGVELRGPMGPLGLRQPGLGQHPVHRPMVHPKLAGNGAYTPRSYLQNSASKRVSAEFSWKQ